MSKEKNRDVEEGLELKNSVSMGEFNLLRDKQEGFKKEITRMKKIRVSREGSRRSSHGGRSSEELSSLRPASRPALGSKLPRRGRFLQPTPEEREKKEYVVCYNLRREESVD